MPADQTMPTESKWSYQFSPDRVKSQLLGLRPVYDAIDAMYPRETLALAEQGIYAAIAEFERDVHIDLSVKTILTWPQPSDAVGVTYDLSEDQYDYTQMDYGRLGFFQLRHRPIVSVQQVAIGFSYDNVLFQFPADWIRINLKMGRVSIVPNIADGYNATYDYLFYLPSILAGYGNVIPNMVAIDYTAGISDLYTGTRWADLRMWILKRASVNLRESCWEMLPQGGGIDGASASFGQTADITNRITQGWEQFKVEFGQTQTPIQMAFA